MDANVLAFGNPVCSCCGQRHPIGQACPSDSFDFSNLTYVNHRGRDMGCEPRSVQPELMTAGERAIYDAKMMVARMGADPLLEDAILSLERAQRKVAEYVDARILNCRR